MHPAFIEVIAMTFMNPTSGVYIENDTLWKVSCDDNLAAEGKHEVHQELLAFVATCVRSYLSYNPY